MREMPPDRARDMSKRLARENAVVTLAPPLLAVGIFTGMLIDGMILSDEPPAAPALYYTAILGSVCASWLALGYTIAQVRR